MMRALFTISIWPLCALTMSGCGLIFGGNQQVDNKSHDYEVVRLDRDKPQHWRRIDAESLSEGAPTAAPEGSSNYVEGPSAQETGDVAFEHIQTGALISINSVCGEARDATLEDLSKQLLLGLQTSSQVVQRKLVVANSPAIESQFETIMSHRTPSAGKKSTTPSQVKVRAIVVRKQSCTYDIMYIASPAAYERHQNDFDRFLKGFHAE